MPEADSKPIRYSEKGGRRESFNGKLRNELLGGEIFYTLREAQVIIEQWRWHYNRIRPHSALGYRPPAPETTALRLTTVKTIGETQIVAKDDAEAVQRLNELLW